MATISHTRSPFLLSRSSTALPPWLNPNCPRGSTSNSQHQPQMETTCKHPRSHRRASTSTLPLVSYLAPTNKRTHRGNPISLKRWVKLFSFFFTVFSFCFLVTFSEIMTIVLISDQHHYSPACVRHGSASLVEMLKYGKLSQTETRNPCSSPCLLHDVVQNSTNNPNYPSYNSRLTQPFPPYASPSNQRFSHDSTRHLASPPHPLTLQRPTELCLSAPNSPQSWQHCKTCRSVLLNSEAGRPRGNTYSPAFSASAQLASVSRPHSPTSPHLAPPSHRSCSASPTSNTQTNVAISPPSQVQPPWSLYEGRDLTLLNQCLHHIINLRTSSPNLSAHNPGSSQGELGGRASTILASRDRSQSMIVSPFFSPSQDRSLLSPCDIEGRPSPSVG